MIPSGYKEDVVYSAVPTDGSGDLSFTRASNGTRINSAGLVEVCPWNLFQSSETFNLSPWATNAGATITNTTQIAPNGTTTADILSAAANTSSGIYQVVTGNVIGQVYTASLYVKNDSGATSIKYQEENCAVGILFNAVTGAITGTFGTVISSSVENAGNGWYRIQFAYTSNATTNIFIIYSTLGTANTFVLWGAQLNIGSTAKPYFPTTDRLNVPRLTYQNGGGGCPSLLLEKQSTNLFTYSEQLDNAAWTKNNTTVTANATTSPDGTSNADKIADSINTSSAFYFYQSPATTSTQYTSSGYFKKGEYNFVTLHAFGLNGAVFNLNTGVLVSQSGGTGTIQSVGDGWYRCTFTFTAGGSAVFFSQSPAGNISYTGTIGSGIYAWGLQCEASSYVTSLIQTTSASATRVADACFKTGISSLIGQTEGFIAGEVEGLTNSYGAQSTIMSVSDGTTQNRVMFSFNATTGYVTPRIFKAGSTIFVSDYAITLTQKIKFAIGWGGGRAVCYVNGTQVQETTGLTFFSSGTLTRFGTDDGAGSNIGFGKVGEYILGTTNLTNQQLQSLTI